MIFIQLNLSYTFYMQLLWVQWELCRSQYNSISTTNSALIGYLTFGNVSWTPWIGPTPNLTSPSLPLSQPLDMICVQHVYNGKKIVIEIKIQLCEMFIDYSHFLLLKIFQACESSLLYVALDKWGAIGYQTLLARIRIPGFGYQTLYTIVDLCIPDFHLWEISVDFSNFHLS